MSGSLQFTGCWDDFRSLGHGTQGREATRQEPGKAGPGLLSQPGFIKRSWKAHRDQGTLRSRGRAKSLEALRE